MNEWNILDLYFKNHKYPFTSHHLDSYRDFIKNNIPNIIKSYNPITMIKYNDSGEIIIKIEIYVGNKNSDEIFIDRPITFDGPSPKIITPNEKNRTLKIMKLTKLRSLGILNSKMFPLFIHSHMTRWA